MRSAATLMVLLVIGLLLGCGKASNLKNANASEGAEAKNAATNKTGAKLSATEIVDAFKAAGLPIGAIVFYTEENDPNKLLGRPGQYIEKMKWADKRVKQNPDYNLEHRGIKEDMDPEGGGIEVFNSLEELELRKTYLEQPLPIGPPLVEYRYVVSTALVRLDRELTPKQAKEYEAVINKLKEQIQ